MAHLAGPTGTSRLMLSVHERDVLTFEVGEAIRLSMYSRDAEGAEVAAHVDADHRFGKLGRPDRQDTFEPYPARPVEP